MTIHEYVQVNVGSPGLFGVLRLGLVSCQTRMKM